MRAAEFLNQKLLRFDCFLNGRINSPRHLLAIGQELEQFAIFGDRRTDVGHEFRPNGAFSWRNELQIVLRGLLQNVGGRLPVFLGQLCQAAVKASLHI